MSRELSQDNIRSLLNSAQQQKHHRSAMITTLMGFVFILNGGLWSYFLIEYIKVAGEQPTLFLIPSAVSAISLGGWRIYTRYLDNQLASLYSELIFYEARLSAPYDFGESGYLIRNVPRVKPILESELQPEKKSKAIAILAESKHIGSRGHDTIEIVTLCFIVLTLVGSLLSLWWIKERLEFPYVTVYFVCLMAIVVGFALVLVSLCSHQRNPSTKLVADILEELRQSQS